MNRREKKTGIIIMSVIISLLLVMAIVVGILLLKTKKGQENAEATGSAFSTSTEVKRESRLKKEDRSLKESEAADTQSGQDIQNGQDAQGIRDEQKGQDELESRDVQREQEKGQQTAAANDRGKKKNEFVLDYMAVQWDSWTAGLTEEGITIYQEGDPVMILKGEFDERLMATADGIYFTQNDEIHFYRFATGQSNAVATGADVPRLIGVIGDNLYFGYNPDSRDYDRLQICELNQKTREMKKFSLPGVCDHTEAQIVNRQLFYTEGAGDISPVDLYWVNTENGTADKIARDVESQWIGWKDKLYYFSVTDMENSIDLWKVSLKEYDLKSKKERVLYKGKFGNAGYLGRVSDQCVYLRTYGDVTAYKQIEKESSAANGIFSGENGEIIGQDEDGIYFQMTSADGGDGRICYLNEKTNEITRMQKIPGTARTVVDGYVYYVIYSGGNSQYMREELTQE